MKLSELIAKIGDENVQVQNLDHATVRLSTKANGITEITFGTPAATTINGTKQLGIVVWLDRDAVEKAKEAPDDSNN